jgi:hypothetical protein
MLYVRVMEVAEVIGAGLHVACRAAVTKDLDRLIARSAHVENSVIFLACIRRESIEGQRTLRSSA